MAQFKYKDIDFGENDKIWLINSSSQAFQFPTGKSYFLAFHLPAYSGRYKIAIQSYALGEVLEKAHFFYPQVDLLDEKFNVVAHSSPQDFVLSKSPVPMAEQKTWGLRMRQEGFVSVDSSDIKYMVIFTTSDLLKSKSNYFRPLYSHIILPLPQPAVIPIPNGKRRVFIPHSPFGLLNIVLGSTSSYRNTVTSRTNLEINSASQFVVVDQSEPAFIVFTGIPNDIDKDQLGKIKKNVSSKKSLTMLTWQHFLGSVNGYAQSVILRNDYPDTRVVDGIVCLLASKQGTGAPWGLTWNGGIALTYNDYQHAIRTYKSYKANPTAYRPIQDPRRDPVNPGGHLPLGGCN